METAELLSHVRSLGINLWLDGDDLRFSAPRGTLTPGLRAALVERKAEILAFLRQMHVGADAAGPESDETFVTPRTPTEKTLAEIWADLLGIERLGVHDNFFELGGDSLVGFQVIARANQVGLRFTPGQILQHQTIAELAGAEGAVLIRSEQELVTGPVPLAPEQRFFFELERLAIDPHRWNVAKLFEARQALEPALVERAVQHILVHHDMLRARFVCEGSGWRQLVAGPGEVTPFTHIDVSEAPPAARKTAIETAADGLQNSLNLSQGPLLRVALFSLGADGPDRLLIIVHHLVSDATSMRILSEDLETAYRQLARGERIQLPPKTTSFKRWAERFNAQARSAAAHQEMQDYWPLWSQVSPLPMDYPEGKRNRTKTSQDTVEMSLSVEETDALLREIPRAYGVQIVDVLLAALLQAVTQWSEGCWLAAKVLNFGRGAIPGADDMDLSRTVGQIAFAGYVLLEREESDGPEEMLKSVREQLRRLPNQGLGYRSLFLLDQDAEAVEKVTSLCYDQVNVFFNYLGQMEGYSEAGLFRRARESTGATQNPQNKDETGLLLWCTLLVRGGRLIVSLDYYTNVHKRTTIEAVVDGFLEALRASIASCRSPTAKPTP